MTLPPFASLLNRRLVIPSPSTAFTAVDSFFLRSMMRETISKIRLDPGFYLSQYPDIMAAIDEGTIEDAKGHYVDHGYYEHRLPYEIRIDEDWYLTNYSDVRSAVEARAFADAQSHFVTTGFKEGRLPFPGFALESDDAIQPIARAHRFNLATV